MRLRWSREKALQTSLIIMNATLIALITSTEAIYTKTEKTARIYLFVYVQLAAHMFD